MGNENNKESNSLTNKEIIAKAKEYNEELNNTKTSHIEHIKGLEKAILRLEDRILEKGNLEYICRFAESNLICINLEKISNFIIKRGNPTYMIRLIRNVDDIELDTAVYNNLIKSILLSKDIESLFKLAELLIQKHDYKTCEKHLKYIENAIIESKEPHWCYRYLTTIPKSNIKTLTEIICKYATDKDIIETAKYLYKNNLDTKDLENTIFERGSIETIIEFVQSIPNSNKARAEKILFSQDKINQNDAISLLKIYKSPNIQMYVDLVLNSKNINSIISLCRNIPNINLSYIENFIKNNMQDYALKKFNLKVLQNPKLNTTKTK